MSRDKMAMYFDNESGTPFFEGGSKRRKSKDGSMSSKKGKQVDTPVPEADQEGFIRKTFGLFSVQVLTQLIVVVLCVMDVTGEGDERKYGSFSTFVKKTSTIAVSAIIAIIATAVVVMKKSSEEPLSTSIGYPCWVLQTVGLSFVVGYVSLRGASGDKVLCAEIATMLIAFICVFFGGKILKGLSADKATRKLGPTFLVLSLVLATVLICAQVFKLGGAGNVAIMCVCLVLAVAFMMVDTKLILDGKYSPMTKDDYIFASMKLYADFILVFTIIMSLCE